MNPNVPVVTAPYAMIAETLQGKTPANFVLTNLNTALSQANVESVFTNTNFANLMALLNGTSSATCLPTAMAPKCQPSPAIPRRRPTVRFGMIRAPRN